MPPMSGHPHTFIFSCGFTENIQTGKCDVNIQNSNDFFVTKGLNIPLC